MSNQKKENLYNFPPTRVTKNQVLWSLMLPVASYKNHLKENTMIAIMQPNDLLIQQEWNIFDLKLVLKKKINTYTPSIRPCLHPGATSAVAGSYSYGEDNRVGWNSEKSYFMYSTG